MVTVTAAVEGPTDTPVVRKILAHVGLELGTVHGLNGKSRIDSQLVGYNSAARFTPWLVLRDLDQDAPCAPGLAAALLPRPASQMRFRIAVRSIEAWLIADAHAVAAFLRVRGNQVPSMPDALGDPKVAFVNIARHSRSRAIRDDIVPEQGVSGKVGPAYTARVIEFTNDHWRPSVASARSESLARCIAALQTL